VEPSNGSTRLAARREGRMASIDLVRVKYSINELKKTVSGGAIDERMNAIIVAFEALSLYVEKLENKINSLEQS
jgi:hypothetical protein